MYTFVILTAGVVNNNFSLYLSAKFFHFAIDKGSLCMYNVSIR